ncbi:transaldolase [Geoanaerobacter pelophilus]|uniref:Transaldolase n=1 Tax=Geoanaerobacter pelophilus TaxID=60036 RepID=A0ABQ0MHR4_9BACT|nr:transaldolase family protein [Geoanaerobacter pelophilus]GAW65671.1 transaldolase [Geoanaerobacter pelophilus]
MENTPLATLVQCGQSVWLDGVVRQLLLSGELISLVQDGITGVTSNLSLLDRSIASTSDYDGAIAFLARQGQNAQEIYETLLTEDLRLAADLLHPLYLRLHCRDGFVSLGVSPHLAHDGAGMLSEARRLWERVDRPNLLVGIPGTREGVAALRQLVREGINVNATLVFALPRYLAVARAYQDGLSERAARGLALAGVASAAIVAVGRIDALVDPILCSLAQREGGGERMAAALKGEVGMACAKVLRQANIEVHSGGRYLALAAHGARQQRLVFGGDAGGAGRAEALLGPGTVDALPLEAIAALRDHGSRPAGRLDEGVQEALATLERLHELGVDLNRLAQRLENEGVERAARLYESLLRNIELKRQAFLG